MSIWNLIYIEICLHIHTDGMVFIQIHTRTFGIHWFIGVEFMRLFISHYSFWPMCHCIGIHIVQAVQCCDWLWINKSHKLWLIMANASLWILTKACLVWFHTIFTNARARATHTHIPYLLPQECISSLDAVRCAGACFEFEHHNQQRHAHNAIDIENTNNIRPPKRHLLKNFVYFMYKTINSLTVTLCI